MSSHPTFDPNQLEEIWPDLIQATDAPLLNRATQGRYHPGSAVGPLLLAASSSAGAYPDLPAELSYTIDDFEMNCSQAPSEQSWGPAIANGCPGSTAALADFLGYEEVLRLFSAVGWRTQPAFRLEVGEPLLFPDTADAIELALSGSLRLSPLQMALMAAALSAEGTAPTPRLAVAVRTPTGDWTLLPPLGNPLEVIPSADANAATTQLTIPDSSLWMAVSVAPTGGPDGTTWFIGGTNTDWQGRPLAIALVLEDEAPLLAAEIGLDLLNAALAP